MSGENIEAFYEKVESDKDLQAKLKTMADEHENAAIAEVVKIAKAAGFEFTAGELAAFRAGRREASPSRMLRGMGSMALPAKDCCYYAQSCMPGFSGGGGGW